LFAPSFLVTADKKGSDGEFFLERVMESLDRAVGIRNGARPWRLQRIFNSYRAKSVVLMEAETSRVVVRIPRSELMQEDEERSCLILQQVRSNPAISTLVPLPILNGEIEGVSFFAQTHLNGVPLSTQIRNHNRRAYLQEVNRFLRALNPGLPSTPPFPVSDISGPAGCRSLCDFVLQRLPDDGLRTQARALIHDSLRGAESRLGIAHGDFGASNILVSGLEITGVIDWETARDGVPPVIDAFNYLESIHRFCGDNVSIVGTLPLLARGDWPEPGEMEFLRDFFAYCGIDFRFRRGFALLYLMSHIGSQLRFHDRDKGPLQRLQQVLHALLA